MILRMEVEMYMIYSPLTSQILFQTRDGNCQPECKMTEKISFYPSVDQCLANLLKMSRSLLEQDPSYVLAVINSPSGILCIECQICKMLGVMCYCKRSWTMPYIWLKTVTKS